MSAVSTRIDTPDTIKGMKSVLAKARAAWRTPERRTFPKFTPGKTSTADYVNTYLGQVGGWTDAWIKLTHHEKPAPFITGPEVTAELIADAPDERVSKAAPAAPKRTTPKPTTTESTMTKTTLNDKHAKINAYIATQNMPALSAEECDRLLAANAMSPKRVIRTFKDAKAAAKPAPTEAVAEPKAEPVITRSTSEHTITLPELKGKVPANFDELVAMAPQTKTKARKARVNGAAAH